MSLFGAAGAGIGVGLDAGFCRYRWDSRPARGSPPTARRRRASRSPHGPAAEAGLATLDDVARTRVASAAAAALAGNTRATYASQWNRFRSWCERRGIADPLDADAAVVAAYLAERAETRKLSTVRASAAAIAAAALDAGRADPTKTPLVSGHAARHRAPARQGARGGAAPSRRARPAPAPRGGPPNVSSLRPPSGRPPISMCSVPLPLDTPLPSPVWFRPSGRPILGGIQGITAVLEAWFTVGKVKEWVPWAQQPAILAAVTARKTAGRIRHRFHAAETNQGQEIKWIWDADAVQQRLQRLKWHYYPQLHDLMQQHARSG